MKVRIISPSSIMADPYKKLEESVLLLNSHGFEVQYNHDLFGDAKDCRFYANSREFRLQDLKDAILDDQADIIWAFRGGYGAGEIVEECIELKPVKQKILIGFSDITAIGALFTQIYNMPFLHASAVTTLLARQASHIHDIKKILSGEQFGTHIEPLNECAKAGISGEVTGGNLCMVQTLIGTKLHLQTKGKILFLEDVAEPGYKIARMLNHLERAGVFEGVIGCILGDFTDGDENIDYVLGEFVKGHNNIPIYRIASGHGDVNHPILMGRSVSILNGLLSYRMVYAH